MPYIIRNTKSDLWRAFQARTKAEGRSIRWTLEELIRRYNFHGIVDVHFEASSQDTKTDTANADVSSLPTPHAKK